MKKATLSRGSFQIQISQLQNHDIDLTTPLHIPTFTHATKFASLQFEIIFI